MMNRTGKKTELLSPAGSFDILKAVALAGADAVYAAGQQFGARAYADNLTKKELLEGLDYLHLKEKRLYLTVNTLLKNRELERLYDYLYPLYEAGLDGVIVQDIGVLHFVREHFPGLPIHASTQMNITGAYGAKLLLEAGCSRIVTARELSLEEISHIYETTGAEIESFVHGALCYSHSGQCLLSSMIGGRSGNRGRCAQPCRLPYQICDSAGRPQAVDAAYPLSLKDMCTITYLPQLIEAGIDSFKIEGRMKKAEYAAGVTALYRKYIDLYIREGREACRVSREDLDRLQSLYIRSELQTGYYERHNGREMITLHKPSYAGSDESVLAQIRAAYLHEPDRAEAAVKVTLEKGRPSVLQITGEAGSVTVEGAAVEDAIKAPLQAEDVRKRFLKTGNSCIRLHSCDILMPQDCFLPVRAMNELRRAGIEAYERQCILRQGMSAGRTSDIDIPTWSVNDTGPVEKHTETDILVSTYEQLAEAVQHPCRRIYIDSDLYLARYREVTACITARVNAGTAEGEHRAQPAYYVALPYILRAGDSAYTERLTTLTAKGSDNANSPLIRGFLVRNYEEAAFVLGLEGGFEMVPDAGLYCFNSESIRFWAHYCREYTLPWELNRKEAGRLARFAQSAGMRTVMTVYGRIPMMVTANCIRRTAGQCPKAGTAAAASTFLQLKDRYGVVFPVAINCTHCYNIIYNSVPFSLHQQENVVKRIGADVMRYDFTTESAAECRQILSGGKPFGESCTTGHLKRGVE